MTNGWWRKGYWQMACWNVLSGEQQNRLIIHGNLPLGYRPEGIQLSNCIGVAELSIEAQWDEAPGPRFYCRPCAIEYLQTSPRSDLPQAKAHGTLEP